MKKQTIKNLYSIILILSITLAIYSSYLFATASHNIDLGQNIRFLNAQYGLIIVDTNSVNEVWTGEQMYSHGQFQSRRSLFLMGLSVLLIGFSLSKITKLGE